MELFTVNSDGSKGNYFEDIPRPSGLKGWVKDGIFYRLVHQPHMELQLGAYIYDDVLEPEQFSEDALCFCMGQFNERWEWIVLVGEAGLIRGLNEGWITPFTPEE